MYPLCIIEQSIFNTYFDLQLLSYYEILEEKLNKCIFLKQLCERLYFKRKLTIFPHEKWNIQSSNCLDYITTNTKILNNIDILRSIKTIEFYFTFYSHFGYHLEIVLDSNSVKYIFQKALFKAKSIAYSSCLNRAMVLNGGLFCPQGDAW